MKYGKRGHIKRNYPQLRGLGGQGGPQHRDQHALRNQDQKNIRVAIIAKATDINRANNIKAHNKASEGNNHNFQHWNKCMPHTMWSRYSIYHKFSISMLKFQLFNLSRDVRFCCNVAGERS